MRYIGSRRRLEKEELGGSKKRLKELGEGRRRSIGH